MEYSRCSRFSIHIQNALRPWKIDINVFSSSLCSVLFRCILHSFLCLLSFIRSCDTFAGIARASYVVFTLFLIFMTNECDFVAAIGIEANSKQRKSIKNREKAMKCFVIGNFLVVIVYATEIVCMKRNNRHKRIASKQKKKSIKPPPIDRMWNGRRKNRKDLCK